MIARSLLLLLLLVPGSGDDPLELARVAYQNGNYQEALLQYEQALKELPTQRVAIQFNMAQCWFALDSFSRAEDLYNRTLPLLPAKVQAIALNNLGLMADQRGRTEEALEHLKQSLITWPAYEPARYNYELIKRREPDNPPPPPPQPPTPPPPNNQPPPTENDGTSPETQELSPEAARAKLAQLKEQEGRYLQELRRANRSRKRSQIGKPW